MLKWSVDHVLNLFGEQKTSWTAVTERFPAGNHRKTSFVYDFGSEMQLGPPSGAILSSKSVLDRRPAPILPFNILSGPWSKSDFQPEIGFGPPSKSDFQLEIGAGPPSKSDFQLEIGAGPPSKSDFQPEIGAGPKPLKPFLSYLHKHIDKN